MAEERIEDVRIRGAQAGDAAAICAVHQTAVRRLCAADYGAAQIEAWVGGRRAEHYVRAITRGDEHFVVAERDARVVGFASMAGDEIRAIFVDPDRGRGTGTLLLRALEEDARRGGVTCLRVSTSLTSVPFYERHGFRVAGTTWVPLPGDLALEARDLEKPLAQAAHG